MVNDVLVSWVRRLELLDNNVPYLLKFINLHQHLVSINILGVINKGFVTDNQSVVSFKNLHVYAMAQIIWRQTGGKMKIFPELV